MVSQATYNIEEKIYVWPFMDEEAHRMSVDVDPENEVWGARLCRWSKGPVVLRMNKSFIEVKDHNLSFHKAWKSNSIVIVSETLKF